MRADLRLVRALEDLVKKIYFRWRQRMSLNQKSTKYVRKTLGCINFYFLPSSKILIEQKVVSFFSRSKNFQKIFKNRKIPKQGFQLKIFENQDFWKFSIFEKFQLKSLFFDFFDFWKSSNFFCSRKKMTQLFARSNFFDSVKNKSCYTRASFDRIL